MDQTPDARFHSNYEDDKERHTPRPQGIHETTSTQNVALLALLYLELADGFFLGCSPFP